MVGAHIDHLGVDEASGDIYYGADDNASGSAVVLEMARMIDECEIDPARTVLLALWNAEKMGLIGSYYYTDNPTYPLEDSDHYPFVVQGIPAVSVDTIGNHFYYHTPDDHIGNIQIENLEAAANLVLAAMAPIALGLEDYFSDPYKQAATQFCPVAPHRPEMERFR